MAGLSCRSAHMLAGVRKPGKAPARSRRATARGSQVASLWITSGTVRDVGRQAQFRGGRFAAPRRVQKPRKALARTEVGDAERA